MKLPAIALVAFALVLPLPASADPTFPERNRAAVVDGANVIPDDIERRISTNVLGWVKSTGHQFVVVTVPNLQGYPIEDYGYKLGRAWGIGNKNADDGVLLIWAPKERKVRIEIGRGFEPYLTDSDSEHIMQSIIIPRLKAGNGPGAMLDGSNAIMRVGSTAKQPEMMRSDPNKGDDTFLSWLLILGIPAVGIGGWGFWSRRRRAKAERERLSAVTLGGFTDTDELKRETRDYPPSPPRRSSVSPLSSRRSTRSEPISNGLGTYASGGYDYSPSPSPSPAPSPSSSDCGGGSSSFDSGFSSGGGDFGGGGSSGDY